MHNSDNPEAFACSSVFYEDEMVERGAVGMRLRDYFAAAAITGLLSASGSDSPKGFASIAYKVADAMLAVREETATTTKPTTTATKE